MVQGLGLEVLESRFISLIFKAQFTGFGSRGEGVSRGVVGAVKFRDGRARSIREEHNLFRQSGAETPSKHLFQCMVCRYDCECS